MKLCKNGLNCQDTLIRLVNKYSFIKITTIQSGNFQGVTFLRINLFGRFLLVYSVYDVIVGSSWQHPGFSQFVIGRFPSPVVLVIGSFIHLVPYL